MTARFAAAMVMSADTVIGWAVIDATAIHDSGYGYQRAAAVSVKYRKQCEAEAEADWFNENYAARPLMDFGFIGVTLLHT